jgi:hypothetical protein
MELLVDRDIDQAKTQAAAEGWLVEEEEKREQVN